MDQGWRYQAAYKVNLLDDLQLSWLNERHTAGFTDLSRYQDGVSPGGMRQRWTATVPTGRWGDVSGVYENEYSSTGNTRRSFGVSQQRSEEHTSELQSLMRIAYAVFCLKKKKNHLIHNRNAAEYE